MKNDFMGHFFDLVKVKAILHGGVVILLIGGFKNR